FVHINVKAVLAAYKNEIEEAKEKAKEQFEAMKAMAEMEKAAGGDAPGAAPGPPMKLLQIFPGSIDILIEGLYQVESYDAGGNIGKDGVTVREAITLDKSGSIARALGAFKPLKEMMPALPALDSFFAAGWINVDMKKLLAEYLALIEYADAKMGLTEALGEAYIEEMKTSMKNSSGLLGNALSVVISIPPAEEKQGIIAATQVIEVTDEEAYRKEMARGTAAAQKMMAEVFGNLGVGDDAPKTTFTHKGDAEKIAGVSVDHMKIVIEMPVPEGAPPAGKEQMEMMMKLIYGPEGLLMRTAIVDGKAIVTFGGPGEMARAIAAVKGQKPGLGNSAALKGLCGKLPKGYSAVGFLSIPGFAQMMSTMMQKMMHIMMPPGAEAPPAPKVEAPKLTSAIVAGLTVNGNVCRFDLHVPMAEILAGKEAITGMMGAMM
ncbi:MAG: hypothetical protein QF662_08280, partial [Phycisphaerae bacterium]|nr:hypothetical protein [Phycisphaerae bacterium]